MKSEEDRAVSWKERCAALAYLERAFTNLLAYKRLA